VREVFISYAHRDNLPNSDITHEHTQAIDHFLEVYKYVSDASVSNTESELFYIDRSEVRSGEHISDNIRSGIEECSVMLAFISPAYFSSRYCLQEWKEFRRAQREEIKVHAVKLLIPVEVRPTKPEIVPHLDSLTPEWWGNCSAPRA
jgi:TIR domain